MSPRKRKSAYLQDLERRRDAARRQQPEETNETNENTSAESRILVERGPIMWPSKPRRRPWK